MHRVPIGILTALSLTALACSGPASVPDAGPILLMEGGFMDAPLDPNDQDGDGVCDATEASRGTDPLLPDTDNDGFSDWAELVLGFDGEEPNSPDRDTVFVLRETPEGSVQVPIEVIVRGEGEDYAGAFEANRIIDLNDLTAANFFVGAFALYANPQDNVELIETESERFRGVVGETLLGYRVDFRFDDNIYRQCVRAFPFQYEIKRSDGRLVALARRTILVMPMGSTLQTVDWCGPPTDSCQ